MTVFKFPPRIEEWTIRDHLLMSVHFTLSQNLTPTARKHINAEHVAEKIVDHLLMSGYHIEQKPMMDLHSRPASV